MTVKVYCSYRDGWYWRAQCDVDGVLYESKRQSHNSACQAANEVLSHVQSDYPEATMQRLFVRVYEITVTLPAQGARGATGEEMQDEAVRHE